MAHLDPSFEWLDGTRVDVPSRAESSHAQSGALARDLGVCAASVLCENGGVRQQGLPGKVLSPVSSQARALLSSNLPRLPSEMAQAGMAEEQQRPGTQGPCYHFLTPSPGLA